MTAAAFAAALLAAAGPYTDLWKASEPDGAVYIPKGREGPDATNQHLIVVPTRAGTFLAIWTQASKEAAPDQRVVSSRSKDRGRTWSAPILIDGPAIDGRIASWAFPIADPATGRVHAFYNKFTGQVDARNDTTGDLAFRISDDDGRTWSRDRWTIPIRTSATSHPDPAMPENWVTFQAPVFVAPGTVMTAFTRWASRTWDRTEAGLFDLHAEVWFFRFENLLGGADPARVRVTVLPEGDVGIRVPNPKRPTHSAAQEGTFQRLSDGRLFAILRTRTGSIWWSESRDLGRSWAAAEPLRYRDGGALVAQPMAPAPLYRLGDGRLLLLFHNNTGGGGGNMPRRPAYLSVGRETPDRHQPVSFGAAIRFLDNGDVPAGPSGHTQIGTYTSFFEFEGDRYLFYPDRKHFLLWKRVPDEILRGDPGS
ncbi:MAG: exo-alpha-sialidase [Planctomycetes bacterium]|nr:exo-alpha-sialidase [Planctomycetota bacterium]